MRACSRSSRTLRRLRSSSVARSRAPSRASGLAACSSWSSSSRSGSSLTRMSSTAYDPRKQTNKLFLVVFFLDFYACSSYLEGDALAGQDLQRAQLLQGADGQHPDVVDGIGDGFALRSHRVRFCGNRGNIRFSESISEQISAIGRQRFPSFERHVWQQTTEECDYWDLLHRSKFHESWWLESKHQRSPLVFIRRPGRRNSAHYITASSLRNYI